MCDPFSALKKALTYTFPATGKVLTKIALGSSDDVDIAVTAARQAFKTSWGLNAPGSTRANLINKLADLVEQNADELAALESLSMGENPSGSFGINFADIPFRCPILHGETNGGNGGSNSEIFCWLGRKGHRQNYRDEPCKVCLYASGADRSLREYNRSLFSLQRNPHFYRVKS